MSFADPDDLRPARGGRPSREAAEQIRERILDAATELFLADGFGATSIEAVAQKVRMSKRTFYARFRDKTELFDAVVHRILARLRPGDMSRLFTGGSLEEILTRLATLALQAALKPEAIALHRLVTAEAPRFPELMTIVSGEGTRNHAVEGISALLRHHLTGMDADDAHFAAEQFLQMSFSLPQRRSMVAGTRYSDADCADWAAKTVKLFLRGVMG